MTSASKRSLIPFNNCIESGQFYRDIRNTTPCKREPYKTGNTFAQFSHKLERTITNIQTNA